MMRSKLVREAFAVQASACNNLGSPFTAELCTLFEKHLDESTAIGRLCLNWQGDPSPSAESVPLRLCGGLNALVLSGRDVGLADHYPPVSDRPPPFEVLQNALFEHEEFLTNWMQSPPQTNEVARAAVVWPGLMAIASLVQKPLHLLEVGASAGLNLNLDKFGYRLGDTDLGDAGSAVQLAPEWQGNSVQQHEISISTKEGCDLNPLSANSEFDALRLRSYCWPDQSQRVQRLNAALDLAQQFPVNVEKADAIEWLTIKLQELPEDVCTVIYSTIAWQYLPEDARAAGERLITTAAGDGKPLAWLRFEADREAPGAGIRLQVWPNQIDCLLGRADFHGRWVDWRGLR